MAPLPGNFTHRIYFDYVTGTAPGVSKEHTVMWRINGSITPETAINNAQARFLTMLQQMQAANFRIGWKVIRMRFSEAGSVVSLPLGMTEGLGNFVGDNDNSGWTAALEAVEYSWQGRSGVSGRRGSFSLYGLFVPFPADFRLTAGEHAIVNSSLVALTEIGGAPLVALDGNVLTWYPYINVQYNSYWESRIRRG